jgi:hypothetical protein
MTRRRVDRNQVAIVKVLRDMGAQVFVTSSVGHGFPDLVVGWKGAVALVEIKFGDETLTPDELEFHNRFHVEIVRSVEQARDLILEWGMEEV